MHFERNDIGSRAMSLPMALKVQSCWRTKADAAHYGKRSVACTGVTNGGGSE
jgi:hypothetical protein